MFCVNCAHKWGEKKGPQCSQQAVAVVFVGRLPPFQKEGVAARPGQALAGKRNVPRARNTSLYLCFVQNGLTSQVAQLTLLPVESTPKVPVE